MLEKQDLQQIRTVVREEVTEKFDLLDNKIDQLGLDMAEMIEERVLPQIQSLEDKMMQGFDAMDIKMETGFSEVNGRIDKLDGRIDKLDGKFDALAANTARKSELKIVKDDLRREFRLQHAK